MLKFLTLSDFSQQIRAGHLTDLLNLELKFSDFVEWDDATAFAVDAYVVHNEAFWQSLQTGNLDKEPGAEPAFWVQVFTNEDSRLAWLVENKSHALFNAEKQGVVQMEGVIRDKCEVAQIFDDFTNAEDGWSDSNPYAAGDSVYLLGIFYRSLKDDNIDHPPSTSPEWWTIIERHPSIVMYLIDIILYHLSAGAMPRQTAGERTLRYKQAEKWLNDIAHGLIDPDLPPKLDAEGEVEPNRGTMRWGINPQQPIL